MDNTIIDSPDEAVQLDSTTLDSTTDEIYEQLELEFDFERNEPVDELLLAVEADYSDSIHSSTNIPKGWFRRRIAIGAAGVLLFASGDILEKTSEMMLTRDVVAEPFDVADHIGNTKEAAMVTVASFLMMSWWPLSEYNYTTPVESIQKAIAKSALGALAVSSTIQAIGEKFELSPGFGGNSGDVLDALYGIGYSGIVALAAYGIVMKLAKKYKPQPPEYLSAEYQKM